MGLTGHRHIGRRYEKNGKIPISGCLGFNNKERKEEREWEEKDGHGSLSVF
jgi:hypothetical protein